MWANTPFDDLPTAEEENIARGYISSIIRPTCTLFVATSIEDATIDRFPSEKRKRFNELVNYINRTKYHFVTLQEVFHKIDYDFLVERLPDFHFTPFIPCGGGPNSETIIFATD